MPDSVAKLLRRRKQKQKKRRAGREADGGNDFFLSLPRNYLFNRECFASTAYRRSGMALIRFETNANTPEERVKIISRNLTRVVARFTGEPETEIRVEFAGNRKMRMAASDEPIAHIEICNAEIPKNRARELTQAICPVVEDVFGIHNNNIYIAVISKKSSMWRVNGDLKE